MAIVVVAAITWQVLGIQLNFASNGCEDEPNLRREPMPYLDAEARGFLKGLAIGDEQTRAMGTAGFRESTGSVAPFKMLADLALDDMTLEWAWLGAGVGGVVCRRFDGSTDKLVLAPGPKRGFALLTYAVEREVMDMNISLQFLKEDDAQWQVHWIGVYAVGDRGKTALDYELAGDGQERSGHPINAMISYMAAGSLMLTAPHITTIKGEHLKRKMTDLQEDRDFQLAISRRSIPRGHQHLQLGIKAFGNDGLFPVVSYVSQTPDARSGPEAEALLRALEQHAPGLRQQFPGVAVMAYGEPPTDPAKHYKRFGTVVNFGSTMTDAGLPSE